MKNDNTELLKLETEQNEFMLFHFNGRDFVDPPQKLTGSYYQTNFVERGDRSDEYQKKLQESKFNSELNDYILNSGIKTKEICKITGLNQRYLRTLVQGFYYPTKTTIEKLKKFFPADIIENMHKKECHYKPKQKRDKSYFEQKRDEIIKYFEDYRNMKGMTFKDLREKYDVGIMFFKRFETTGKKTFIRKVVMALTDFYGEIGLKKAKRLTFLLHKIKGMK